MFDQWLIRVGGPPGGGKTTFIKAVVETTDVDRIVVVRDRRDEPTSEPDSEIDDFMDEDWDIAVDEGHDPTGSPDLTVHVMAASAGPVLERRHWDSEEAWRGALLSEAGIPREYTDMLLSGVEVLKELKIDVPSVGVRWSLTEEHRGIGRSQLVIVNVRGDDERERAEALVADVARLRRDPEVFADLKLALVGRRTSITVVVADLADHLDAGTRKALARVRRALRTVE